MGTVLSNPLHKPFPLFLLGLGVTIAYIPGIVGAAISTDWLFLFIVCPILFLYCEFSLGFGFLFICYMTLSLLWTETVTFAVFNLLQYTILGIVFIIGQNLKDIKPVFKGLAFGLGVSSVVALSQYFGNNLVYSLSNSPAGLFINPNIYSEISVVVLMGLLTLKLWHWLPFTFAGLLLVQSRTAFLALGVSLFVWAWKQNKHLAVILTMLVGLLGTAFYWDKFSISSIFERFDIWKDTLAGFKLFGNGVGSFEISFPQYATHIDTELARPRYAHNDILNVIFEFGLGSIFLFLMLLNVKFKNEAIILLAVFIISMLTYPMHVPATAFIAFLVAGYLSRGIHTFRDRRDYWRSTLFKRLKTV